MKLYHKCVVTERPTLNEDINQIVMKWRCSDCGQLWRLRLNEGGSWKAERISTPYPNIRNWRWQQAQKSVI